MDRDIKKQITRSMGEGMFIKKIRPNLFLGKKSNLYYVIPALDPEEYIEMTKDDMRNLCVRMSLAIPQDILYLKSSSLSIKVFLRVRTNGLATLFVFRTCIPSTIVLDVDQLRIGMTELLEE